MTLPDTIESCCQDHGLPSRTAASVAERVMDRLTEEAEQGCAVAAAVLRPIDRTRLRAELLTAGRVLTDPLRAGLTEAHRLGALDILLQRIAYAAGEPDVAEEIATMRRARHERAMSGYRERTAALPDLGGEPALETARRLDGDGAACLLPEHVEVHAFALVAALVNDRWLHAILLRPRANEFVQFFDAGLIPWSVIKDAIRARGGAAPEVAP